MQMRIDQGRAVFAETVLDFEGRPVPARIGETIAAALTASGIRSLRLTARGEERGIFCGMGVCQDCLVEVDGKANLRACMTRVERPHRLRRQAPLPVLTTTVPAAPRQGGDPAPEEPQIVVIGGGAGGLTAAASAAEAGAEVVLIDERPQLGGQYFKQPAPIYETGPIDDAQFRGGAALIARTRRAGVAVIAGMVWGAFRRNEIAVAAEAGTRRFRPQKLIVATGAYERPLPVEGWTFPGVMTTGAAQTLLRSYRVLPGRRILVAGNGPLNLQVARELARAGAKVAAVAEASSGPRPECLGAVLSMLRASPRLTRAGLFYLGELKRLGIPLLYAHRLRAIEERPGGLRARLERWESGAFREGPSFDVDCVLMGYGFLPSNELLRAVGADQVFDKRRAHLITLRDANCETSVPGVYGVGDCCGLGGAHAAMQEGTIAGLAAAQALGRVLPPKLGAELKAARARLARHRRFQRGLWELFAPVVPSAAPPRDVLVCRCEEVTSGTIEDALAEGAPSIGELKRVTRLGMGRCQGRYCATIAAQMIAARRGEPVAEDLFPAPRPPGKPMRIGDIVR